MAAATPAPSKPTVSLESDSKRHGDGAIDSSSMLGVGVSVLLVGLALLLLPFSYVTVLMAALAGVWWLSSGTSSGLVHMSHPSAPGAAVQQQEQQQQQDSTPVAPTAGESASHPGDKDEQLGLDPPNFGTGHSVTAKRLSLAAAVPAKLPAAAPGPAVAAAATQPGRTTAAVPPVAADSSSTHVAGSVTSTSFSKAGPAATSAGPNPASSKAPEVSAAAAAAATKAAQPEAPTQQQQQQQQQEPEQPAAPPAALTGSAAILAKLRQQRASSSVNASSGRSSASSSMSKRSGQAKVTVLYASQTGTGQEIARSIHAECAAKGLPAEVMSMNELGFDNLRPDKTPVVVVVASSTGDGDPPDNSATAFVALKKSWPADRMVGLKFTVLGLGDSNYTRFMHVPRVIKNRLQDLGGQVFYPCAEADEVDGLETTVDPWVENILGPMQAALQQVQQQQQTPQESQQPQQQAAAALPAVTEAGDSSKAAAAEAQAGAPADPAAAASRPASAAAAASPPAAMQSEGSASSTSSSAAALAAAAATVAQTAAVATGSATSSARSTLSPAASGTAPVELVNGLAPKGVDLKGAPPLAPCRITLNQQVSAAVAEAVREKEQHSPSREQMGYRDPTGAYSAATPFWATVADAKLLTADWSDRTVIHVELDLADSGMRLAAGDAVGVLPCNDPALVAALLARLSVDGDAVFEVQAADEESSGQALLTHIAWPCTFRHAFTTGTDITSVPRKSLLRLLAEHCRDTDEQRTLMFFTSRAGREAYASEITAAQPSLLDLLRRFPSCQPPVHALLDTLPPLAPRMYSLTNAPVAGVGDGAAGAAAAAGRSSVTGVPGAVGPKRAQFALSVVEFETQYGTRRGVATTWLAKLCRPWLSGQVAPGAEPSTLPQAWVPLFLRHAAFFKPPADLSKPMIMIGPGTGVAPFRGFLQQRLADMQAAQVNVPGQALLYFGCRKPEEDYLYEQDWQEFLEAGALSKLRVAFSRAQANKVYVQQLLKEDGPEVAKLIAGGAHVYVCGDGAAMAKDVHAALQAILRDQLGMSEAQAGQELTAMTKEGRYVRDIWS